MENLKDSLRRLRSVVIEISEFWTTMPELTTIQVLLQNLIADDNLTEDKCQKVCNIVAAMKNYNREHHVLEYIESNLNMDVSGYFMSIDIEKEEEHEEAKNPIEVIISTKENDSQENKFIKAFKEGKLKYRSSGSKIESIELIRGNENTQNLMTFDSSGDRNFHFEDDGYYFEDKGTSSLDLIIID